MSPGEIRLRRCMLHFLLVPLLLLACYCFDRPGSPARIAWSQAHRLTSEASSSAPLFHVPSSSSSRPQLLGRLLGCICLCQQHGGQEHCCRECNPPSVTTSAALQFAHCARQANQSCTLAHHCFTKTPLCRWSSDSASTNIADAQNQILNAPPLVKVLQLLP